MLVELPGVIGLLTRLTSLGLHHNKLTNLPNSASKLTLIQKLYLGKNLFSQKEKEKICGWFNSYVVDFRPASEEPTL